MTLSSSSFPPSPPPMPATPLPPSAFPGFALHHLRYLLPLGALFITALAQKVYYRFTRKRRRPLTLEGPGGIAHDWHHAREISDGMGLLLVGHARELARLAKERDDLREQCGELQGQVSRLQEALTEKESTVTCPVCGHDATQYSSELPEEGEVDEKDEEGFWGWREGSWEEEDSSYPGIISSEGEGILNPPSPIVRSLSAVHLSGNVTSRSDATSGPMRSEASASLQDPEESGSHLLDEPVSSQEESSTHHSPAWEASPPSLPPPLLPRRSSAPAALADPGSTHGLVRDLQRISAVLDTAEDQVTGMTMAIQLLHSSASASHRAPSQYRHSVSSFSDLARH
ncbi:hypothetical protein BJ684DRAFT_15196 [Piptocephalis cylindrospora]|uniref:Uncharacterized protein n=1 Tax=Piptocephalis cylindrospora TaxID=1907219 RepID=A0A4P9Y643_9FUNG|nr:hypothetical protein BJ684DRAFT_15196 [Piptocephalis cylindrospora]|eukprot:RKP14487.1 hypothetical protein BJ684DRAFT_15196 [Piptocephalis cylindrospora]